MINVSVNELTSLLKRAFESLNWAPGEYEDAAEAVAWSETRGLYGIHRVMQAWPRLERTAGQLQAEVLEPSSELVLDAVGDSILKCGANAVCLVHSNSYSHACASLEIRNCHDRGFIMYSMAKCALKGRTTYAKWKSMSYDYSVLLGPGLLSASYIQNPEDDHEQHLNNSLFLACSENPSRVARFQDQHSKRLNLGLPQTTLTSEGLAAAHTHAVDNGLSVPPQSLEFFETMAKRVLVPNSEQSRSGAGE